MSALLAWLDSHFIDLSLLVLAAIWIGRCPAIDLSDLPESFTLRIEHVRVSNDEDTP